MMNRSYFRLTSGYLILIAAVFLILGFYLVRLIHVHQVDDWRDQLLNEARLSAAAIGPLASGDDADVNARIGDIEDIRGGSLAIVDAEGEIIAGSTARPPGALLDHPDIQDALQGDVGEAEHFNEDLGRLEIAYTVPVALDDGATGALLYSVPANDAPGVWTPLSLVTVAALVFAALGIAAVSSFIPRIITQPLGELTGIARRVSAGDLDARADTDSYEEISELAIAFNEMTGELRKHFQAIEFERARLEAIVEHLNDGILIVDPRGSVSLINHAAERLLGVERRQALVRSYTEVVRDHELVALIRNSQTLYDPDRPLPNRFIELGLPRRAVQAFAYPVSQGENELVIVILRDITELRRTETVRRDFVANVSHDLRTPIASLKALVETLLDGALEDDSVARDFLGRMEVEVDDLARLVEELLELSRAESRRIELHQVPTDIASVVNRATIRLRTHAEPRQIEFDVIAPEDLPLGYFDPERIEQVLVNLLHNAIKFNPSGENVRIELAPVDEELQISVTDRGPGIPPDELDRVFERFYKTDQSRSDSGSGLGLAIARHLVQAHGGRIWADSGHRGGATFHFTVPVASDEEIGE